MCPTGSGGTAGSLVPKRTLQAANAIPGAASHLQAVLPVGLKGDLKRACGRLSLEVNGVALGQLASDIEATGGLCWMAELCGGEMLRVIK